MLARVLPKLDSLSKTVGRLDKARKADHGVWLEEQAADALRHGVTVEEHDSTG